MECVRLTLFHKAGFKHEAFDVFRAAVDLFRVTGEADIPDHRPALEGNAGTLDGEVLNQGYSITIL